MIQPPTPIVSSLVTLQNISCNNVNIPPCDGYIELSVTGGTPFATPNASGQVYIFEWYKETPLGSGNFTLITSGSPILMNACVGNYKLKVVDANGCIHWSVPYLIENQFTLINIVETISNYNGFEIACNGGNSGYVHNVLSGGSGTYNYVFLNQTTGSIISQGVVNALNPLFSSKQQMENYDYANSAKVTQNAFHGVECNPQLNAAAALYVRSGNVPTGQDAKTYDLGIFQFAVSNGYQTSSINLGEVWVSYKIKLRKTKLILPGNDLSPVIWNAVYTFTATSLANIFSGALVRSFNNNTQADITANTSNVLTFPSFVTGGTYEICLALGHAIGIGYSMLAPSVLTNCALTTANYRFSTTTNSGTSNNNLWFFYIVVTGPSPTITLQNPTGTFVAGTTGTLYVSQVSSSIL